MDSKKPEPGPDKPGPEKKPVKPVLTEKQRAEARRQRQQGRRRKAEKQSSRGNALSRGMRASGTEIQRTFLFVGRSILSALDFLRPVGGVVVRGLLAAIAFIGTSFRAVGKGIGVIFNVIGRVLLAIDGKITPRRAIAFVGAVAAGVLVASQFIDYRATEIGQPGYIVVETITHAPRVEQLKPTDSHSFLLVIAGLIALAASVLSFFSRRRQAGIAMTAVGGLTIIVALAFDLPKALDVTTAELSYAGVKAVLLSGFWLELGAGAVLAVTGLATLLGRDGAPAPARRTSTSRTRRTVDREAGVSGSGMARSKA